MKRLILIAGLSGLVALSGCSKPDDSAMDNANEPIANEANEMAPVETAASESPVGTYDVKMADGTMGTTTINADGTYSDTGPDGKVVSGTFTRKDGKDCFDPEGDGAELCWTSSAPGADGSFTSTAADGTTVTVTPKAE